ncbi:MAG TPA: hypothetical protein PL037_06685, partial [Elusimicrobiales bacterium]|nr:hypothetical protein [Elusimicrobiales bacterium]
APVPQTGTSGDMSARGPDYVPAIMRERQERTSSLELFSETNRGLLSMEEKVQEQQPPAETEAPAEEAVTEQEPAVEEQPAQESMAQQMLGKLTGSLGAGLSTSMGTGSSKYSGTGGFGNNFKPAAMEKPASLGEVGEGFSMTPAFSKRNRDLQAKKALAMTHARRPVYSSAGAGKGATGKGAFSQAKGVRTAQKSYIGNNAEAARATQEKAWDGGSITDGGVAGGGAGLTAGGGGSGIVTSPSLDNIGNVGGSSQADEPVEAVSPPLNVSPWQGLPQLAMMLTMLSAALSVLGGQLIMMGNQLQAAADPVGANQAMGTALRAVGMTLCGIAIGMGGMATAIGGLLSTMHDQAMMGGMYASGGGIATAAGIVAMTGDNQQSAAVSPSWMAAIAGGIGMMATMSMTMIGSASTAITNSSVIKSATTETAITDTVKPNSSIANSDILDMFKK